MSIYKKLRPFFHSRDTDLQKGFPAFGISRTYIRTQLDEVKDELGDMKETLGWLHTTPHAFATHIHTLFLEKNPNNIGNWSYSRKQLKGTRRLEYDVIHNMISLYHGEREGLEGYITSGGSESNIFCAWIGRTFLERWSGKRAICFLSSPLAHYSLLKSSRIIGVDAFPLLVNANTWGIDCTGLKETIESCIKKGYTGFLLPITLGYPQTGVHDDLPFIGSILGSFSKMYPKIKFFSWVDASFDGMTIPFRDAKFSPFNYKWIYAFLVDYHKFGQVPYSAGVVLYRKQLRKFIERHIDFLPFSDATLLGSRPGVAAATVWGMMHLMGKKGYEQLVDSCFTVKAHFIQRIKVIDEKAEILTNVHSLTCGVIFHSVNISSLHERVKGKFGLHPMKNTVHFYPGVTRRVTLYEFYFLPHITKKTVDHFIEELTLLRRRL